MASKEKVRELRERVDRQLVTKIKKFIAPYSQGRVLARKAKVKYQLIALMVKEGKATPSVRSRVESAINQLTQDKAA